MVKHQNPLLDKRVSRLCHGYMVKNFYKLRWLNIYKEDGISWKWRTKNLAKREENETKWGWNKRCLVKIEQE